MIETAVPSKADNPILCTAWASTTGTALGHKALHDSLAVAGSCQQKEWPMRVR